MPVRVWLWVRMTANVKLLMNSSAQSSLQHPSGDPHHVDTAAPGRDSSRYYDNGPLRLLDAMEYEDRERRRANAVAGNTRLSLRQRFVAAYYGVFDRRKKG